MTWATVSAQLDFNAGSWTLVNSSVSAMTANQETAVLNTLQVLYNGSPTAAQMLEDLASEGPIRMGVSSQGSFYWNAPDGGDTFFSFNPSVDQGGYYMNDHGVWTAVDNGPLTLAHELAHADYNAADPVNDYGLTDSAFDFKGTPVRIQNTVAAELGESDLGQASYHAAIPAGSAMLSLLTPDQGYADGNAIDISIFGSDSTGDYISLSSRTDSPAALLFGFGGDDTIVAASGNAYIYGGQGDDLVTGGSGSDHLFGGVGDDHLIGGAGNDTINGDSPDYDTVSGSGGTDTLEGGNGNDQLISTNVGDWVDPADDTVARSVLQGGAGDDTIVATTPGAILNGGPGDDVIDARDGNYDTIVQFGVGDGHDTILTTTYDATGDYGTDEYTYSGIGAIEFGSLSASDLEVEFTNWHVIHSYPTVDWVIGDVQIVIKSTGESISICRTDAYVHDETGSFNHASGDTIFDEDISPMKFDGTWSYGPLDAIAGSGGLVFG